jgi:hypothetical protein
MPYIRLNQIFIIHHKENLYEKLCLSSIDSDMQTIKPIFVTTFSLQNKKNINKFDKITTNQTLQEDKTVDNHFLLQRCEWKRVHLTDVAEDPRG